MCPLTIQLQKGFGRNAGIVVKCFLFFFFPPRNKNIETFRLFISVPSFSDQNCYLSAKVWSLSYSTSMQACCNGRCKNPSSEKQGEKEPCSDFGFRTHLLWLSERGPGKGWWVLAMISFFHSCLRVVQPHPGLVEGCPFWRLWLKGLNTGLQTVAKSFLGFTRCPDKWFSSPQSKGVIMDGQLACAGWCPQPACGTTLVFHYPQMFPKSDAEQQTSFELQLLDF